MSGNTFLIVANGQQLRYRNHASRKREVKKFFTGVIRYREPLSKFPRIIILCSSCKLLHTIELTVNLLLGFLQGHKICRKSRSQQLAYQI